MLGDYLRKKVNNSSSAVGEVIGKTGINPNLFSLGAIPIALIAAYFIYIKNYPIALIFILFAAIWDAIDGSVARAQKKASKFGNYFDALLDKYVEIAIYLGFAISGYEFEAFLVISGSLVLSYAKPRTAMVIPIDNHDWPAIGERSDRMIFLAISMIIRTFVSNITFRGHEFDILSILLIILGTIVYIGSIQRILYAKKLNDCYLLVVTS